MSKYKGFKFNSVEYIISSDWSFGDSIVYEPKKDIHYKIQLLNNSTYTIHQDFIIAALYYCYGRNPHNISSTSFNTILGLVEGNIKVYGTCKKLRTQLKYIETNMILKNQQFESES